MSLQETCKREGLSAHALRTITHHGAPVDPGLVLWAIAGNESSHGKRREFVRAEPGYLPDGHYYRRNSLLRSHYYRYGCLGSASFGSWQIMHIAAFEMGFRDHPIELQKDDVSVKFVVALIENRFIKAHGARTLTEVLDAYNSGNHKDANKPEQYIKDGIAHYERGWV